MAKLCFKSQLWEVRRSCSFTEIQIKLLTLFISWIFRVEVSRLSHHRIHHRKVAKEYFWVSQSHQNLNSAITHPLLSRYAAACIQQPLIDEVAGEPHHSACTNDTKSGRKQGWILETKLVKLCEVDVPPTFKTSPQSPQSPTDTDLEKKKVAKPKDSLRLKAQA